MSKPIIERVAIVGSRDGVSEAMVRAYVETLPMGSTVISGGAKGVDTFAIKAARARGLYVRVFEPDYWKHDMAAPLVRNKLIAESCDRMVVFWNGKSRGSMYAARCAERLGKPVETIQC